MKRMGIFVYYDEDGIVDEYVYYLLNSFHDILEDFIVVSNGPLNDDAIKKFKRYAGRIFFRDDIGFDYGACKDLFCKFIVNEDWEQWDEVVILNDTFYGPIYDWNSIFDYMESKDIDFWGLDEGNIILETSELVQWVVPYFYVVRKQVLTDGVFKNFWQNFDLHTTEYGKGFGKVGWQEYELTKFLQEKKIRYTTWLRENGGNKYLKNATSGNHNVKYSYELLKYCKFPVIRKKALSNFFYPTPKKSLDYIMNYTDYDVSLIIEHQNRMYKKNAAYSYSNEMLKDFVEAHDDIYIFGHGVLSNGLTEYFKDKNWRIKSYVVSNPTKEDEISLKDLSLGENDGVIVALGIVNLNEMRDELIERIPERQLLMYGHRSLKSEMKGQIK